MEAALAANRITVFFFWFLLFVLLSITPENASGSQSGPETENRNIPALRENGQVSVVPVMNLFTYLSVREQ